MGPIFQRAIARRQLDDEFRPLERRDAKLSQYNYGADRFDLISIGSTAYDPKHS